MSLDLFYVVIWVGGDPEKVCAVFRPAINSFWYLVYLVFVKSDFIPKRKKSKRRKKSETDASKDDQAGVNRHLPTPPGEEPLQPASVRWNQVPMCQVWCTRWNQMTLTHLPMRNMLVASMLCKGSCSDSGFGLDFTFPVPPLNSQLSRGWNIWKCSSRQSLWLYHQRSEDSYLLFVYAETV